jgi:hypothetical protein
MIVGSICNIVVSLFDLAQAKRKNTVTHLVLDLVMMGFQYIAAKRIDNIK